MTMADSLFDILSQKDFDVPSEIAVIKRYVADQFQETVEVVVNRSAIIITVPNAALASTLRFRTPHLRRLTGTDKRLVLRIG